MSIANVGDKIKNMTETVNEKNTEEKVHDGSRANEYVKKPVKDKKNSTGELKKEVSFPQHSVNETQTQPKEDTNLQQKTSHK